MRAWEGTSRVFDARARRAVAAALVTVGALVGGASSARGDEGTTRACVASNEDAQALERSGRLRDARARAESCDVPSCPGAVRADCAAMIERLDARIPTVVLSVRAGDADDELHDVAVTFDGAPIASHLDGTPLDVDPGTHELAFAAPGYARVVKRMSFAAGEKGRRETVRLAALSCVVSNEEAQSLEKAGKLRDARARASSCAIESCPGPVRDDCVAMTKRLDARLATVVFHARGAGGAALHDVRVTVDGAPLAERLDDAPLPVDPGEHAFGFSAPGYGATTRRLTFGAGERGREETIDLAAKAGAGSGAARESANVGGGVDRRTVAYALGGAGFAGLGLSLAFVLHASALYPEVASGCQNGDPSACSQATVDDARAARAWGNAATAAFMIGTALVGAGVVLFVLSPRKDRRPGAAGSVEVSVKGGGARLRAAW